VSYSRIGGRRRRRQRGSSRRAGCSWHARRCERHLRTLQLLQPPVDVQVLFALAALHFFQRVGLHLDFTAQLLQVLLHLLDAVVHVDQPARIQFALDTVQPFRYRRGATHATDGSRDGKHRQHGQHLHAIKPAEAHH
jgi:hypothetical protein